MKCRQAEQWMDAALDAAHGTGLPATAHARLEEHLSGCPSCRRQWELLRSAEQALSAPRLAAVPEGMLPEFRRRLQESAPAPRSFGSRWSWIWPVTSLAAAGATAALVMGLNLNAPQVVTSTGPAERQVAMGGAPAAPGPNSASGAVESANGAAAPSEPDRRLHAGGAGEAHTVKTDATPTPVSPKVKEPGTPPSRDPFRLPAAAPTEARRSETKLGDAGPGVEAPEPEHPAPLGRDEARERAMTRETTQDRARGGIAGSGGGLGGASIAGGFGRGTGAPLGPSGPAPTGKPEAQEAPKPPAPPVAAATPAKPDARDLTLGVNQNSYFQLAETPVELNVSPALLNALQRPVAVELDQLTVQAAAVELTEKADIPVVVDPKAPRIRVSVEEASAPLWLVLENVARQGGMRIYPEANQLVLRPATAQDAAVRLNLQQKLEKEKEAVKVPAPPAPAAPSREVRRAQAPPPPLLHRRQLPALRYHYRGVAPDRAIWSEEWGVLPEAGFTVATQEAILQQQAGQTATLEAGKALKQDAPPPPQANPRPAAKKSAPRPKR